MIFGQKDYDELGRILEGMPDLTLETIVSLCSSPDAATAQKGFALRAAWHYRSRNWTAIRETLDEAVRRFPELLPAPLFTLKIDGLYLTDAIEQVPDAYLEYGFRALAAGQIDLGLEALGTALVNDSHRAMKFMHDPRTMLRVTEGYEQAAATLGPAGRPARAAPRPARLTIGLLVPNLVDDTVAYARRVGYFARFFDASRFALRVYSTENMCPRPCRLPVMLLSHPSADRAPKLLADLQARQVPVWLAPRDASILETARRTAAQLAADGVDLLVMQAGPAMPIDWLTARCAPVPVKIHIHIGASNYMRGLDATLFDNATNLERERAHWPEYAGALRLMRRGTDLDALRAAPALSRSEAGVPDDAVVVGVLSNRLAARLSPACLEAITQVLQRHPEAWFVAAGVLEDRRGRIFGHFQRAGVVERVRFLSQQRRPGAYLKMIDLYANEFPAGGSQSVIEAMACGVPVAAMRCGETHHESVGADLVGAPWAIDRYDPPAYAALISGWVADRAARREAGAAMRERAEREFSVVDYVRKVCELGAELYQEKTAS